jgi:hypothetical protein
MRAEFVEDLHHAAQHMASAASGAK